MIRIKEMIALAALSLPLISVANGAILKPSQSSVQTTRKKVIIDENTILFRGEVDTNIVSKIMAKMYASTQDNIVIFIDSPGGNVTDGLVLFDFIANFNKPTICYINNAASMAFVIAQACTERYVSDTTTMMQHQAFFGGQGTIGKMMEMSRFGGSLSDRTNELQAKRMGMSKEAFEKRIVNDWWIYGKDAVSENAADKVVYFECKPELIKKTYTETVQVFMIQVQLIWSSCPLIVTPLAVSMGGDAKPEDTAKVKKVLDNRMEYMKELNGR